MKNTLVTIVGPTAVGKTNVSIQVAAHFKTEIISADSRQFYREMNIGVAKPVPGELLLIPHHFVGHLSVDQSYSAGDFEKDALDRLSNLFLNHSLIVMTGGSGLFIKAVLEGLDTFPEIKPGTEDTILQIFRTEGIPGLQRLLEKIDPVYYKEVDLSNPHRLLRALAVCLSSGKPYSSFRRSGIKNRMFSSLVIGLNIEREVLYNQINDRVDNMLKNGLVEEVRALLPFRDCNALQTVGYGELFDYFDGKSSLDEAVLMIKQHSRNYAKRQMTWFRKQKDIHWFHPADTKEIISFIESKIKEPALIN